MSIKPVRERVHPHLQPDSLSYGTLFIYPSVKATAAFDSNIFADPDFAVDDRIFILSPEVRILKESGRFKHEFRLDAEHYEYERFQSQNRTSGGALFRSDWEVNGTTQAQILIDAAFGFESREDSLTSIDSVIPIGYRNLQAEASITKQFGDFGTVLGGGIRYLSYDNGETSTGTIIDQSFRDGTVITANFKPFYDLSPDYRIYMQLAANKRDYEGVGNLDRDSEGFNSAAGLEFKLTPLVSGNINAGYLYQEYNNPSITTASGASISMNISWLITPLITISGIASRSTADIASFSENGRLDTLVGLQLDYEVRRNMIINLDYLFKDEDFNGSLRSDNKEKLSGAVSYYINQSFLFKIGYDYFKRDSNLEEFAFDKHTILASVSARY